MAKYEVTFSCGHTGCVELYGKESERQRKLEWFAESGLCKECYKKQMEEETAKMPITITLRYAQRLSDDGEMMIIAAVKGNTKPRKDEIKSLGFYWGEEESVMAMLGANPELCWQKLFTANETGVDEIKAVAEQLGAEVILPENQLEKVMGYSLALSLKKEWDEKHERIAAIPKPQAPEVVKDHKWNQKIYGKKGGYSIYPDGVKTAITDEQATELEDYIKAKEEYKRKVNEIK